MTPGASLNTHGDAYADISGGWGQCLTEITGQSYNTYNVSSGESAASLSSLMGTLSGALSSHEEVIMATSDQKVTDNLVVDHMFMVSAVNASAGMVSLMNPWGDNGAGCGKAMSFTESISALAADNASFFATSGRPTIA